MPVRVAHMITPFEDAGAERQLLELLKRVDRSRIEPVLYLSMPTGFIWEELQTLDIPVVDVGEWGDSKRVFRRLTADLRRRRVKIVHGWLFVANTWARIAGRLAGVPIIVTSDRSMHTDLPAPYRLLDTALSPLATRVVVNAQALADHVHRGRLVPRRKIVTIYNGVDLEKYGRPLDRAESRRRLDLPIEGPVIGMVASFLPRKRWDVFLQAVAHLARTRAVTAISVGEGTCRSEMEACAARLGLQGTVRFYGARKDIPEVMAALDILVLSSDDEGTPNVILQAMASRIPVVATDAGGTAEIMVHGQTGFVVPRRNHVLLAGRVETLLDHREMARAFGLAGRRRVEQRFTFEECTRRTIELYEDLLAEHLRRRGTWEGA